jgi:2-C-methyl-D-erythritol 2,4-cyclodiphosphate synthase
MGDIGQHFPPSEPQWKDADSMEMLARVVELIRNSGLRVGNVDVTVITERPKIAPSAQEMVARLAEVLGIALDAISVKGKTNEGMGWIGAGEGLAVHAVALLEGSRSNGDRRST